MPSSSSALVAPGSVFAHEFRVVRALSEGGMGAVYVVEQLSTGALRALKLMHPQLVADPSLRARFVQEARVGAKIKSDHVVQVLGAGIDAHREVPWIAMELLEGEDLAHLVARHGALGATTVREIFAQLCHAVGAAHAAGIVHRDLKPENIFLAESRRADGSFSVKVLDFGIAKLVADVQTHQTIAIGTPLWMAPEQTERGGDIRPSTDVWALGLIAFRLLAGRPYWRAANDGTSSPVVLMREVVLESLATASSRATAIGGADLPVGFDAWFARCVTREPSGRFADAREAWQALEPLLGPTTSGGARIRAADALPSRSTPVAATVAVPAATLPAFAPEIAVGTRPKPGRGVARISIVVVAVFAIAGACFVGWRALRSPTKAASPGPDSCGVGADDFERWQSDLDVDSLARTIAREACTAPIKTGAAWVLVDMKTIGGKAVGTERLVAALLELPASEQAIIMGDLWQKLAPRMADQPRQVDAGWIDPAASYVEPTLNLFEAASPPNGKLASPSSVVDAQRDALVDWLFAPKTAPLDVQWETVSTHLVDSRVAWAIHNLPHAVGVTLAARIPPLLYRPAALKSQSLSELVDLALESQTFGGDTKAYAGAITALSAGLGHVVERTAKFSVADPSTYVGAVRGEVLDALNAAVAKGGDGADGARRIAEGAASTNQDASTNPFLSYMMKVRFERLQYVLTCAHALLKPNDAIPPSARGPLAQVVFAIASDPNETKEVRAYADAALGRASQ